MSKPVVYIVIYSLYQHVYKLSLSIKEGLESKGVHVELYQVAETLSDEILKKMQAPVKPDLPILTVDKMVVPDGILFGLPTRFGTMPAQMKTLLDASGALWAKGALSGKFAGTFFSTASQHGGQETTALTAVTYFSHHGMMYVPFGFANTALYNNDEVVGGSAYGAGTVADGDGSRLPTQLELGIAKNQGENFGVIVDTFVKGRQATEAADIGNKNAAVTGDSITTGTGPTTTAGTTGTGPTTGAGVAGAGAGAGAAVAGAGAGAAALAASKSHGDDSGKAASGEVAKNADTGPPTDSTAANTTRTADGIAPTNETPTNTTAGVPKDTTGTTAIKDDTIGHPTTTELSAKDADAGTSGAGTTNAGDVTGNEGAATAAGTTGAGTTTAGTTGAGTTGAGTTGAGTTGAGTITAGTTTAGEVGSAGTPGAGATTADTANVTGTTGPGTTTAGTTDADRTTADRTGGTGTATADTANADTTGIKENQKNAAVNGSTNVANKTTATNASKEGASAGTTAVPSKLKESKPKKKKWFCCG